MMFRVCQSYEYCREQREHVCLNEGHQDFHAVHKQKHYQTENVQPDTNAGTKRPSEEYHACETQYYGMSRHHVCEETDHEGKWLCQYADKLNYWYQRRRIGLQE